MITDSIVAIINSKLDTLIPSGKYNVSVEVGKRKNNIRTIITFSEQVNDSVVNGVITLAYSPQTKKIKFNVELAFMKSSGLVLEAVTKAEVSLVTTELNNTLPWINTGLSVIGAALTF